MYHSIFEDTVAAFKRVEWSVRGDGTLLKFLHNEILAGVTSYSTLPDM